MIEWEIHYFVIIYIFYFQFHDIIFSLWTCLLPENKSQSLSVGILTLSESSSLVSPRPMDTGIAAANSSSPTSWMVRRSLTLSETDSVSGSCFRPTSGGRITTMEKHGAHLRKDVINYHGLVLRCGEFLLYYYIIK